MRDARIEPVVFLLFCYDLGMPAMPMRVGSVKQSLGWYDYKQDGRLALAYFSPNYKYFDQLLQTVKNKTTVLNLVFKEFLRPSIPSLNSVLYSKGYHDFPLKNFCLTVPKNFVEEPFCVSENFCYRKMPGIREGRVSRFSVKYVLSYSAESFRRETLLCFRKFGYRKILCLRGHITIFDRKFVVSQYPKISQGNPSVFHKIFGIEKFYG